MAGQPAAEAGAHGLRGDRLLDVACGTGKSFIPMLERGWEVTACDISPAMVEMARAKVGDAAELSVADMRELPVFGEFDLVWCLDDAVNYLLGTEELERALTRDGGATSAPDGLLMFDVNTMQRLPHLLRRRSGGGARRPAADLARAARAADAEPGTIAEASFEVEPLEARTATPIPPELHRQRHFPEAEVLAALERAGLECLDVYGHGDDAIPQQPLEESRTHKAVYIARRAA